jgi:hypothetical protein
MLALLPHRRLRRKGFLAVIDIAVAANNKRIAEDARAGQNKKKRRFY